MNPHSSLADLGRRGAVGALAAGGLAFALFGPRGTRTSSAGRIVLDYWEKWTGHEGRAMQKVVDEFNKAQDRILVRYFVTGTIHQKALIAIAGGDPPDIVGLWNFNVPAYALADAILPLDELAPSRGCTLDQYPPGMRRVMTYSGRWWALVNTGGTLALYYNRAVFRQCGLDPERPPRTIEELDECCLRIERRDDDRLTRVGFLHCEPGWWSWLWGAHFGGSIYDPQNDRPTLDTPENLAAYRWVQTYPQRLGAAAVERFRGGLGNYNTPQNGFLTGKVAMVLQGPWLANMVKAFAPDLDYGVAPFPVAAAAYREDQPVALIDTDILVVPRGARHPEASMEFVAYTQRRDVTEFLATAHCKGSPLLDVSEEFLVNHPNRGVRLHGELARSPRAFVCPPTRVWPQFKDEFDRESQRMWRLEVPAERSLAVLQTRVQGFIDRAAEQHRRRRRAASGAGA